MAVPKSHLFGIASFLIFGLLLSGLNSHTVWVVGTAGTLLQVVSIMVATGYGALVLVAYPVINRTLALVLLPLLVLLVLYAASLGFTAADIIAGLGNLLQLLVVMGTLLVFYFSGRAGYGSVLISCSFRYLAPLTLMAAVIALFMGGGRQSLGWSNTNSLGMLGVTTFFYMMAYLCTRRVNPLFTFVILAAPILVVYFSLSRTSLLALIVGSLVYFIWPVLSRSRLAFLAFLLGFICLSGVVVYILTSTGSAIRQLNADVYALTGKNLLSGRDVLWPTIIELIQDRLWFGWGAGVTPSMISATTLSSHNLYLQITLQVGVVGLFFLISIFMSLGNSLWRARSSKYVKVGVAYFFGILMIQNFEVTLTQNNMAFGLPFWAFVGLCLGDFAYAQRQFDAEGVPPSPKFRRSHK